MEGVLNGFATIAAVIALGAFIAHVGLVDLSAQMLLSRIAFFVATPALLLTVVAETDVSQVLSGNLVATAAGVAVPALAYVVLAGRWRRNAGERVIGALTTSYVNAGNLGLPVAAYALGNVSFVAPTLLIQLLVLQPAALALLDADAHGTRPQLRDFVVRPLKNPLTLGTLTGLVLAITGWRLPVPVQAPLELVGDMAVPGMLLAYGIALRLGPGLGGGIPLGELALTTTLKVAVQPFVAWLVAHHLLGIDGHALLAVVICSALPTAQNIFIIATRYDRATTLARDTILLTTALSAPAILLITVLLS